MIRLQKIIIATSNAGKVREMSELLNGLVVMETPVGLPFVEEDGRTLEENAYKKAKSAAAYFSNSALADDSGLFVDALGGRPGVHSARYSGVNGSDRSNRLKVLRELNGVTNRRAYFEAVLCVSAPGDTFEQSMYFKGICEGAISDGERGSSGFGYDSIFIPDGSQGRTFAEMSANEKAALSHRGKAAAGLREWLRGQTVHS